MHFLRLRAILSIVISIVCSSCVSAYIQSVGGETAKVYDRIYFADVNTAWQACLDSLKHSQLDLSNREGGFIQTRWTDNTAEKNFAESFGGADAFLKAQYRFKLSVGKGYYNGRPTVKISVQKEQMVQRDVLEGWKPIETDGVDETTLHYRIRRLIQIKQKLAHLEELKAKKAAEDLKF